MFSLFQTFSLRKVFSSEHHRTTRTYKSCFFCLYIKVIKPLLCVTLSKKHDINKHCNLVLKTREFIRFEMAHHTFLYFFHNQLCGLLSKCKLTACQLHSLRRERERGEDSREMASSQGVLSVGEKREKEGGF